MYKSFTAKEYKQHFGFPEDYEIKSFISYGTWNDEKFIEKFNVILGELGIQYSAKKLQGFLSHIYEFTIDGKTHWFALQYGGAMLSEYVHLACLFGSQKNIHIGSCGGLYSELNSLDLIVPEWSYGNDSVTRMYARDVNDHKHYSNQKLSEELISLLTIQNKVWKGPIFTCQAMLGETWEDVQEWSNNGYYGVEMETSTVFAVSNHYSVPCASMVYVSDNLIKGQTVHDESHNSEKETRDKVKDEVFRVAIKAVM